MNETHPPSAAPQTVMERHNITTTDGEIDGHARQHEKDKRNLERRIVLIYETARDGGFTRPVQLRLSLQNKAIGQPSISKTDNLGLIKHSDLVWLISVQKTK